MQHRNQTHRKRQTSKHDADEASLDKTLDRSFINEVSRRLRLSREDLIWAVLRQEIQIRVQDDFLPPKHSTITIILREHCNV